MIMSTGMATVSEIEEAVLAARGAGCADLILLKCTSNYPALPKDANVATIPHLRSLGRCHVGLSDHTMGVGVAVGAIALGATVVEKHFTLRRADGGVDSAFSLEPEELKSLVVETERAWQSMGDVSYGPTEQEKASLQYRRSLYISRDLRAGDVLTTENLRVVRPAKGLHPRFYDQVLGRRVTRDCEQGTPVDWTLLA
jgi:N-acetylneuraminate synthase